MAATASQEQRNNLLIVVLSVRWASQATVSSKSRVCRAFGRAQGTCSVRTPQCHMFDSTAPNTWKQES